MSKAKKRGASENPTVCVISNVIHPELCSSLTELFGEPGHVSLNYGMAKVVGWGSTETDVDDEISIISTSSQQKLDMPVISIKDCINKFKKRGLDLTKDLRFLKFQKQYENTF